MVVGAIAICTRAFLVRGAPPRRQREWVLGWQEQAQGPKPCARRASSVFRHVTIQRPPHMGRPSHRNHPGAGAPSLASIFRIRTKNARRVRLPLSASLLLHIFRHRSTTLTMRKRRTKTAMHARLAAVDRARTKGARARARRTGIDSTLRPTSMPLPLRTHARVPSLPCAVRAGAGGTVRTSRRTHSTHPLSFNASASSLRSVEARAELAFGYRWCRDGWCRDGLARNAPLERRRAA